MLKKILKHTLRTLLVILLVLLLVPALLYVPAVQDLARRRAVAYASRTLGMEVSVERIRLAFPLRLTVDNTLLADRTDTLLRCGRLSLDAALWPLIRKEVVIRSFALERVAAHYKDTLAGMDLRLAAGELSLEAVRADLSANTAGISRLVLADADIRLNLTEAAPAEKKESAAALPWTVGLDRIAVSNLAFGMRTSPAVSALSVRLADGSVDTCRVLLDSQQVSVKSVLLDRGAYSYLTGPAEAESGTSAGTTEASAPWTVRVGRVALTGNSVEYGRLGHRPAAGFDPAFIALAPLDLTIDSVYNRGADIALQIRRTAFTERCGLSVRDLTGRFGMDASGITLSGLDLQTAFSRIRAELTAGAGILKLEPASPLDAVLSADLNTKDLKFLSPEAVPPVLDDRTVRLSFSAAGTLGDLGKTQLEISSPGHLDLKADAAAKNLLDANRMEASARFEGDFRDLAFLKALLPDTALRRRVAILRALLCGADQTKTYAMVDIGQTMFAYTVFLTALKAAGGEKMTPQFIVKNMLTNKACIGMLLGIVLGALGVHKAIDGTAAGEIVASLLSFITAPTSALILIVMGYQLHVSRALLRPVLTTMGLRLGVLAVVCAAVSGILFAVIPFDKGLLLALMLQYTLPAPFIIPLFADLGDDAEYVSTTLSLGTVLAVVLFFFLAAFSLA